MCIRDSSSPACAIVSAVCSSSVCCFLSHSCTPTLSFFPCVPRVRSHHYSHVSLSPCMPTAPDCESISLARSQSAAPAPDAAAPAPAGACRRRVSLAADASADVHCQAQEETSFKSVQSLSWCGPHGWMLLARVGDHLETFCQPQATLRSQLESWRAGR